MKLFVALFLVTIAFVQANESLEGSKVYDVFPVTKKHRLIVGGLEANFPELDVWQKAHVDGRHARILVPKTSITLFEALLNINGIQHQIFMNDPQSVIEHEIAVKERAWRAKGNERISFTAFNRHEEINQYLDDLAAEYPNLVTVETKAVTPNGREMKAIKISRDNLENPNKPIIIVDAGIHAREWAAPALALYMITKLVEDVTESDLIDNIDWVIFPVLNPDGYEHSHTNTRLWRKTRSTVSSTTCPGIDGNRNFDYKWMESGSSNNPCSDIFAGPTPFSEVETSALSHEILKYNERVKFYLAIHSYGSYFLYPYGHDGSLPPNAVELHNLGVEIANAIDGASAPGSVKYLVGNSANALNYAAAGASDDWAMGVGGVQLSYTLELPGGGSSGFDLPPSRIMQVVTETWQGIIVLARYVINGSKMPRV